MSRVGKQNLTVPSGTTLSLDAGLLKVTGPKGSLERLFDTNVVEITIGADGVTFKPLRNDKFARSLWGTYASHVKNMLLGVNTPYVKKLILEGVGFKSEVSGKNMNLALGFSHPVVVEIPEGLTVTAEKNNITITGIDKEAVGAFAAKVRALKKPEPYKGKGFRYHDEVIRRKQGKKTA